MSRLDAHVVVRRPAHTLDVALRAESGDVVALIGPNGSGKTTLLRAVAGVQPMDGGTIRLDEEVWDAPGRAPMPTQDRRIGMVFQQRLLFPHLDARDNVAFGLRGRGVDRSTARRTAEEWLARLGVGDLARRRPGALSGGQAQRVAIARALAIDPRLLLLDEPLAALDIGVAMALRVELSRHLATYPGITLLVTHDPLDAMTIANRVVVIDDGRVAQDGTPEEVSRRPQTPHVARLVGLNVLRGTCSGTVVRLEGGGDLVTVTEASGEVNACFSPTAVTLTVEPPTGSARNRWHGTVSSLAPHGAAVRVHVDTGWGLIADVTPASAARLGLVPGAPVWATVKATEVDVYARSADPVSVL